MCFFPSLFLHFFSFHLHCSPFSFQRCEQGKKLKRIHWVANIGTALNFLEGRKVRVQRRLFMFFSSPLFYPCRCSPCSAAALWAQTLNPDLVWPVSPLSPPLTHSNIPHLSRKQHPLFLRSLQRFWKLETQTPAFVIFLLPRLKFISCVCLNVYE